jgi:nitroreductase
MDIFSSPRPEFPAMERIAAVIRARHCKRAFLPRPVGREILEGVLRLAAEAPSTRNSQPWRVEVVSGTERDILAGKLVAEFDRGVPAQPDYRNRRDSPDATADARAAEAGAGVLRAKGIARDDRAARRAHLRDNLNFYGAPVELIFHLPVDAPPGLFLEMGLFLENVLLGLVAAGLGSCPQYSVAGYADIIREHLGLAHDRLIVCGLAVGYPDEAALVNDFRPSRAELGEFVRWHDHTPASSSG